MTVLEVIQRSAEFLTKKGVESPRLQVELLLANLLKMPRMKLYLNHDRALTDAELDDLRKLVLRRSQHEPLQHITGSTSFCGFEMIVNRHVLVPRPETELLAELAWDYLSKRAGATRVLDFGTGSGCLAITIALKNTQAEVVAVDISPEALDVARKNAANHKMESRIRFIEGDGFSTASAEQPFDLVVANPPYIASEEIATLDPEVRDFDPRLALDGGRDGLDFYRRLASDGQAWLKPGAKMMMELGDGQASAVEKLFCDEKWIVEPVRKDYSGLPRILTAQFSQSMDKS